MSMDSSCLDRTDQLSIPRGTRPSWTAHLSSDRRLDYWNPLNSLAPTTPSPSEATDYWYEITDLPTFDPEARRANWFTDTFLQPLNRDARSKAKWIVALLQPTTVNERAQWLKAFEPVFLEHADEKFFRKVRSIAAQLEEPGSLLGAIAIKDIWQDRHDFQRRRARGARLGIYYTNGGTLSWPMALRIAAVRSDYDPPDMIDPDWMHDWLRLRAAAEGYWYFAEYAVQRAEAEQFEDWDLVASLSGEDARWAAGRVTPIDDISGISVRIRTGHPSVPPAVLKHYTDWREKHGACDSAPDPTISRMEECSTEKNASQSKVDCSLAEGRTPHDNESKHALPGDNKLDDPTIAEAIILSTQDKRLDDNIPALIP